MNNTYKWHCSIDEDNKPDYFTDLERLSVKFEKHYFDIPIYDGTKLDVKSKLFRPKTINWYEAKLTTSNVDLLAFVYKFLKDFPPPKIFNFNFDTLIKFCNSEINTPALKEMEESLSILLDNEFSAKQYLQEKILHRPEIENLKLTNLLTETGYLSDGEFIQEPADYFIR